MQKNPGMRDTWKITSNLLTHDTLAHILSDIQILFR